MVHLLIHSHPGVRAGSRVARSRSHNVVTFNRGGHGCREDHGRREDQGRRRGDHPQTENDPSEWYHCDRRQYHWFGDFCLTNGGVKGNRKCKYVPDCMGTIRDLLNGKREFPKKIFFCPKIKFFLTMRHRNLIVCLQVSKVNLHQIEFFVIHVSHYELETINP